MYRIRDNIGKFLHTLRYHDLRKSGRMCNLNLICGTARSLSWNGHDQRVSDGHVTEGNTQTEYSLEVVWDTQLRSRYGAYLSLSLPSILPILLHLLGLL